MKEHNAKRSSIQPDKEDERVANLTDDMADGKVHNPPPTEMDEFVQFDGGPSIPIDPPSK